MKGEEERNNERVAHYLETHELIYPDHRSEHGWR